MKKINRLYPLVLLILLSSCGLIDSFKGSSEPTTSDSEDISAEESLVSDSNGGGNSPTTSSDEDAFFSDAFNETPTTENKPQSDSPSNITNNNEQKIQSDLNSLEKDFVQSAPEEKKLNQDTPITIKEEPKAVAKSSYQAAGHLSGEVATHTVKRGETLMQIAFQVYGDLSKWRTLKELNNLASSSSLHSGMKLKYYKPESPFVWNPSGTPYLIKDGDTLGIISSNVYRTPKKWKTIWENNKPLIKNPNLIYAGFTLYYLREGLNADQIGIDNSRENYVEKTELDQVAETEMTKFQQEQNTKKTITQVETLIASEEVAKSETKSDANLNLEEQLLTIQEINKAQPKTDDELMGEIESLNDGELKKTDQKTISEIDDMNAFSDEAVTRSQSSYKR